MVMTVTVVVTRLWRWWWWWWPLLFSESSPMPNTLLNLWLELSQNILLEPKTRDLFLNPCLLCTLEQRTVWQTAFSKSSLNNIFHPTAHLCSVFLTLEWGLCFLPLNLGGLITRAEVTLCDFQGHKMPDRSCPCLLKMLTLEPSHETVRKLSPQREAMCKCLVWHTQQGSPTNHLQWSPEWVRMSSVTVIPSHWAPLAFQSYWCSDHTSSLCPHHGPTLNSWSMNVVSIIKYLWS